MHYRNKELRFKILNNIFKKRRYIKWKMILNKMDISGGFNDSEFWKLYKRLRINNISIISNDELYEKYLNNIKNSNIELDWNYINNRMIKYNNNIDK